MPTIYIIAGSNGAGKTTASSILLPKFLNCREFVNADSIASGLSPFQPETVSVHAARIMLTRIKELINEKSSFAFETTLTTKSYINLLKSAKEKNYQIILFYFWINSVELALERIADRVKSGGHNIPEEVVRRRYTRSLDNLVNLFMPVSDKWYVIDNSFERPIKAVKGKSQNSIKIFKSDIWKKIYEYKK